MWGRRQAECHGICYEEHNFIAAEHNGYEYLPGSPVHRRTLSYSEDDGIWTLVDELCSANEHDVQLRFHIHPSCRVSEDKGRIVINFGLGKCIFMPDCRLSFSVAFGDRRPYGGWCSEQYGYLQSTKTIVLSRRTSQPTKYLSRFCINFLPI